MSNLIDQMKTIKPIFVEDEAGFIPVYGIYKNSKDHINGYTMYRIMTSENFPLFSSRSHSERNEIYDKILKALKDANINVPVVNIEV